MGPAPDTGPISIMHNIAKEDHLHSIKLKHDTGLNKIVIAKFCGKEFLHFYPPIGNLAGPMGPKT